MLTMTEYAKLVQTPLQRGVVSTFAMSSPVIEHLPFLDVAGNAYSYNLEQTLPSVGFREVNSDYSEATGVVQHIVEPLKILGGTGKVDRALVKTQGNINDLRAVQDAMRAKAIACSFTKNFFNGDVTTDPKAFDGLKKRLTGGQLIPAGNTTGGDALTLDTLDRLIDAVEGGPDMLFMSKTMRRKVNALARAAGQATETVDDSFGRLIDSYGTVPIGIIERDENDDEILSFTEEDAKGGAAQCSSIYAVKFGPMQYVSGLQCGPVEVIDQGLVGVHYSTSIEWICGLAIFNGRSAARLHGIKNA